MECFMLDGIARGFAPASTETRSLCLLCTPRSRERVWLPPERKIVLYRTHPSQQFQAHVTIINHAHSGSSIGFVVIDHADTISAFGRTVVVPIYRGSRHSAGIFPWNNHETTCSQRPFPNSAVPDIRLVIVYHYLVGSSEQKRGWKGWSVILNTPPSDRILRPIQFRHPMIVLEGLIQIRAGVIVAEAHTEHETPHVQPLTIPERV